MSAKKKRKKCIYHWNHKDEDGYNPCYRCSLYDQENEIYLDFENFVPATNEDRLKNMMYMTTDELAMLLVEINDPTRERGGWINWLSKKI